MDLIRGVALPQPAPSARCASQHGLSGCSAAIIAPNAPKRAELGCMQVQQGAGKQANALQSVFIRAQQPNPRQKTDVSMCHSSSSTATGGMPAAPDAL